MAVKTATKTDPLKGLRQKVQVLRRQVSGLADDDTWRGFLAIQADGRRSTREMDELQLKAVVTALHNAGAPRAKPKSRYTETPQHAKARVYWRALADAGVVRDGRDSALDTYIMRMSKCQDLGMVSVAHWTGIIEGLKSWAGRKGVAVQS